MPLRPHQAKFDQYINEIKKGSPINEIFVYAKPGAGKSLLPAIASQLIEDDNTKIMWVVPRDSLRVQGEGDFRGSGHFDVGDKDIRAADGTGEPFRGLCGCVTTYQSITAKPEKWIELSKKYKIILFLDEYDSLTDSSSWMEPVREIYNNSFLRIPMTGTMGRSDKIKIGFVPYIGDKIDFSETKLKKWIVYNNKQALKDGSILPYEAFLINGSGKYIDQNGIQRSFRKFTGKGDELRCAFTTEFAEHVFNVALKHWEKFRKNNSWSKFLVISPNIEIAKKYHKWFLERGYRFAIATSEDSTEARITMKRFKLGNHEFKSYEGLISVAMIYKGMNAPPCTHLVPLTPVRGLSWLDQAFGRIQRNYPGKTKGFLFTTNDPKMRQVLKDLECGDIKDADGEPIDKTKPDPDAEPPEPGDGNGGIEALSSKAHLDDLEQFREFLQAKQEPQKQESQSEKEHRLRKEITSVINHIVGTESAGNRKVKERIFWLKAKQIVNKGRDSESGKLIRKPLKEMTVKELQKVADFSKNYK
jgi:superfamily II DNA or RNA helicase